MIIAGIVRLIQTGYFIFMSEEEAEGLGLWTYGSLLFLFVSGLWYIFVGYSMQNIYEDQPFKVAALNIIQIGIQLSHYLFVSLSEVWFNQTSIYSPSQHI